MTWLGWLTKGRCEVSILDWLIAGGELFIILGIVLSVLLHFAAKQRKV